MTVTALKTQLSRLVLPRTLRGRLVTGLVALLAAASATVGLVTYVAVSRALYRELYSRLSTATSLAYNCGNPQIDNHGNGSSGMPDGGADSAMQPSTSAQAGDILNNLLECTGLGEHTFVAIHRDGTWAGGFVPGTRTPLTKADEQVLTALATTPVSEAESGPYNTTTRFLSWADDTYELTAIEDPDGDGNIYVTGISLSGVHDFLGDVALAEGAVSAGVLLLAGVLGFYWVRFSLRPLRRVAFTATQVAELPLESGEVSLPAGVPDTDPTTETGQVGLAFNRMLGHVETALRRRAASEARLRRFAADASHELRTPLAAIRGYAELALLHPGEAPGEVTHALSRVLSESTRMSVLVDDLLLLARLDAGRPLNREPVDMTRLAIDATSDAQVARHSHRWVLELPDDPELVLGDEHRLRQVLGNLLSNAGRHTPDGSTVTVRVSDSLAGGEPGSAAWTVAHGTIPSAPRLVVSVTDDGPGIPAELLPDLFERFTRADSSRSHAVNATSTGLGLAIVEAVVAAHHGAVLVTSRPGLTRFTIVLPRLPGSPVFDEHGPAEATQESEPEPRA
jgi:two-component system OmpR family sensor kinase